MKRKDHVLEAIEAFLPSSAEFFKVERAKKTTKRNSYNARSDRTCVQRESSSVKAPGRGGNEAQEWLFVRDLAAEG